jgi:hypothetical protein
MVYLLDLLDNGIIVPGLGTKFRADVGIYGILLSDDQAVMIGLEDGSGGIQVGFQEKALRSADGKDLFRNDLLRRRCRSGGGSFFLDKFYPVRIDTDPLPGIDQVRVGDRLVTRPKIGPVKGILQKTIR